MKNVVRVLDHGFIELISRTGHVGASVVNAARCSFGSEGDKLGERDQKLIAFLLGNGHTSPFRHAFFTFHVKAPLFVFRQWWKYQVGSTWREYETANGSPLTVVKYNDRMREINRTLSTDPTLDAGQIRLLQEELAKLKGENLRPCTPAEMAKAEIKVNAIDIQIDTDQGSSWNELSGRYKIMDMEFYVPEKARRNTGKQAADVFEDDEDADSMLQEVMSRVHTSAQWEYDNMLSMGFAKEIARMVLPPTIYSECYWTVSLQAVLHFLDQRLKPEAQFEIREYAKGILEMIRPTLDEMGLER
jgi:flavin-dependent thymidylate synthase